MVKRANTRSGGEEAVFEIEQEPEQLVFGDCTGVDLPNDIWRIILSNVSHTTDLLAMRNASKYFRYIFNLHEGLVKFSAPKPRSLMPRFVGFQGMVQIQISGARLKKNSLALFPCLKKLHISGCTDIETLVLPPRLEFLKIDTSVLKSLRLLKPGGPKVIHLDKVGLQELNCEERAGLHNLTNITELDLRDAAISEEDMLTLMSLPSLRTFKRDGGLWTDAMVTSLIRMANLESLVIGPTDPFFISRIPFKNFTHLKNLELRRMYGYGYAIRNHITAVDLSKRLALVNPYCVKNLSVITQREDIKIELTNILHSELDNLILTFQEADIRRDMQRMPVDRIPTYYDLDYKKGLPSYSH